MMNIQKILITGATGTMGLECLKQLSSDLDMLHLIISARDSSKNRIALKDYINLDAVTIKWGDLTDYSDRKSVV